MGGVRLRVLADTRRGFRQEILSCFKEWVGREHGELTFQMTQLITGHDCFREYTDCFVRERV